MWFVALFLCLVAGSRQLSVSEFTVPRSVAAGEEAKLTCRYELAPGETEQALYVKWWWAPINASDSRAQLYQRIMGHKPTALKHNIRVEAFDSIVITGAAPPDSGRYECEVSNGFDEIRKHDDLIVYTSGSGPELNVSLAENDGDADGDGNADGDGERNVVMSCVASEVAPEPDLVFTVDGQPLDTNHKEVTWSPSENVYDVVANASVSAARAAGATLACELVYTDARVTHPQYLHTVPFQLDTETTTEHPLETTTADATAMPLENQAHGIIRFYAKIQDGVTFSNKGSLPVILDNIVVHQLSNWGDGATGLTAFSLLVLAALQIAMLVVN